MMLRVKPKKEQPFRRKGERREEEKKRLGAVNANNLTKVYEIVIMNGIWIRYPYNCDAKYLCEFASEVKTIGNGMYLLFYYF